MKEVGVELLGLEKPRESWVAKNRTCRMKLESEVHLNFSRHGCLYKAQVMFAWLRPGINVTTFYPSSLVDFSMSFTMLVRIVGQDLAL